MESVNPYTMRIEGDISRADNVGLYFLCKDKDVVEYGVGGSTILLDKIANKVTSYDTSAEWIERVRARTSNIRYNLITDTPTIPECDVLWIDGLESLRLSFFKKNFDKVHECYIPWI